MSFNSNSGLGHLVQLPAAARKQLSTAYVAAFEAFNDLVSEAFRSGPREGSPAQQALDAETGQIRTAAEDAIENVLFRFRAGLNHARMVALALDDGQSAFGLVTLTRGCIESYGAAWWTLAAATAREMALRELVAERAELEEHARRNPNDALFGINGSPEGTVEEVVSNLTSTITAIAFPGKPPARPNYTKLASDLAEQIGPNGRARYSVYSRLAHGEMMGVAMFLGVTTGTRRVQFTVGLPAWMADDCATSVFYATSAVMKRLQDFMLGPKGTDDLWVLAHDHALATGKQVRSQFGDLINRSMTSHAVDQHAFENSSKRS